MISGNIQDLSLHFKPEVAKPILDFINGKNIETLSPGKYPLSDSIFAIVIKTNSRDLKGQQFEAHRRNLDLHYLVSGKERLGFTSAYGLNIAVSYDAEGDYLLYNPPQRYSQLSLTEKQFVLFYPEDAHCAQGHLQKENLIIKVVFKIPITLLKDVSPEKTAIEIVRITDIEEALPVLWDHDQKMQKINFPGSYPHKELFEKRVRQEYEMGAAYFFVYEEEKIVGSLILMAKENPYRRRKYGDIRNIYLEQECRGKGYGTKMLEFADEYFKRQGCSYAFAGIAAHNPASNLLFEKAGYTKTRFILEKEY